MDPVGIYQHGSLGTRRHSTLELVHMGEGIGGQADEEPG